MTNRYEFYGVPRIIGIDPAGVVRYNQSQLPEDLESMIRELESPALPR